MPYPRGIRIFSSCSSEPSWSVQRLYQAVHAIGKFPSFTIKGKYKTINEKYLILIEAYKKQNKHVSGSVDILLEFSFN